MTSLPIRHILFPTDLSACAEGAFSHAAFLADRFGATLHVLHVRETSGVPELDWTDALQISPEDIAADLGLPLAEDTSPFDLITIEHAETAAPDVAAAILHHAAAVEADLIVMGTHGRSGIERVLLGSVAEAVVRHARCPVFTVRPTGEASGADEPTSGEAASEAPASGARGRWALRRILVAVESAVLESPPVSWAALLASAYRARIDVLRTVPASLISPGESAAARKAHHDLRLLEEALTEVGAPHVVSRVAEGDPAEIIVDTARRLGVDLIIVGSHGRDGVRRALLGSVSERVIREAPCPVFVARTLGVPTPVTA